MVIQKNPMVPSPKTQKVIKLVPPDGGWGWMVILGAALSNIFNMSMLSLFSLLYGDALEDMGHSTQGAALVVGTMLFVSNFGGPIAGAAVKLTSPRFVAVTGACTCTLGIFLSAFSTNIWHLVITYGVLLGLGLDFISNSSFVAINSYFKLKKSRAVGFSFVGTSIGQILMPHVVKYLLESYGFRGACLLVSSLSFHGVAGCLLIQPVERHMKKIEEATDDEILQLIQEKQNNMVVKIISQPNVDVSENDIRLPESNLTIRNENGRENKKLRNKELNNDKIYKSDANSENEKAVTNSAVDKKSSLMRKLYDLFGIALLCDLRFINIIWGTALISTSIMNFSLVYPFFLQKVASMDKQQTAFCMSAVAFADMIGRLTLPSFQDKFKIKARWMLIVTCIWVVISRQILAYQTNLELVLVMSIFYGLGRSMTVVSKNIAISENCKVEQVPAAVGLGMLTMGMISPPVGYFLGWIRDYTGSYIYCITAQNVLLVILVVTWVPDMFYLHMKEKKQTKRNCDPKL